MLCMKRQRMAIEDVRHKQQISCPLCRCPEAIVLLNGRFEVLWECVDCECRWPASDEEMTLLLTFTSKMVH